MINLIKQDEIEELSQLLSDVGILPLKLVIKLLKKRQRSDQQIEIILNQMVKRKLAYYDDEQQYLRINKGLKSSDVDEAMCKALYLMIDLLQNIGDYFIVHNSPKKITFVNKNVDPEKRDPFFDIYCVSYGNEKLECFSINNSNKSNEQINCCVIIDDKSQLPKIKLDDSFKIYNFVVIDTEGNPSYLQIN